MLIIYTDVFTFFIKQAYFFNNTMNNTGASQEVYNLYNMTLLIITRVGPIEQWTKRH